MMTGTGWLLVRIGTERFVFPVGEIEEVVDTPAVEALPLLPSGVVGQLAHRGRRIVVCDPAVLLGVARGPGAGVALCFRRGSDAFALWVDDAEDLVQGDLEALRPMPPGMDGDGVLAGLLTVGSTLAAAVRVEVLHDLALASQVRRV